MSKTNIKDVENELGITRANIRFYEREGLLSPIRKENGYRDYTDEEIIILKKIVIFRKLGLSVADIKGVFDGSVKLQNTIKSNVENLEKSMVDLDTAMDVCDEIISENIDLKDFSEDYFWELIKEKREANARVNFADFFNGYFKKHSVLNYIMMTIVCVAPLLNLLFDYILLQKTPEIKSIVLSVFCLFFPISIAFFYFKIKKIYK